MAWPRERDNSGSFLAPKKKTPRASAIQRSCGPSTASSFARAATWRCRARPWAACRSVQPAQAARAAGALLSSVCPSQHAVPYLWRSRRGILARHRTSFSKSPKSRRVSWPVQFVLKLGGEATRDPEAHVAIVWTSRTTLDTGRRPARDEHGDSEMKRTLISRTLGKHGPTVSSIGL